MRHEKFSSIGRDLTNEIFKGITYTTDRSIASIAIHCSFSLQGRGNNAHSIDGWHMERWGHDSGCGYHYVVLENGTIQKGRWVDYPGAHLKGRNYNTIGICRIGGMGKNGEAIKDATNEQIHSIRKLAHLLKDMYGLEASDIKGHSEYPNVNKSCPLMNMNLIRNIV